MSTGKTKPTRFPRKCLEQKMENPFPTAWRVLSGILLAVFACSLALIGLCPAVLKWAYATCEYDEFGTLYSATVLLGYSVPDLVPIVLVLIAILAIILFAIQLRPTFRILATKNACLASVIPIGVAAWLACNAVINFVGELMWMHL